VGCTTATNDGLPETTNTHSRYALHLLGPSQIVSVTIEKLAVRYQCLKITENPVFPETL
jgi:hypothetical protein